VRGSALVRSFEAAVGSGGTGKQAEGDKKTPLGRYSLGSPRASKEFGIFIPIGYPTAEQRRRGARGGSVGIHGPKRRFAWAGRANVWLNWTRGCIAVATDAEIQEIAAWVKKQHAKVIEIE
jgi:murein L,D-transpeptidase YafK